MTMHEKLWSLRRFLGLSPTQYVFRELRRRGVRLRELDALELFAHTGFLHTKDYYRQVRSLDAWELDPAKEAALRENLPGAAIKITDTYQEVWKTSRRYGLVLADAPDCCHGPEGRYCEHFDILPALFRVLTDAPVVLVNVLPGQDERAANGFAPLTPAHLERRRAFYATDRPERVPVEAMLPTYRRLAAAHGFTLEWYYSRPRTRDRRLHYLALKLKRNGPEEAQ